MGAKMIPTTKKNGRTVLGVRIGLSMSVSKVSFYYLFAATTKIHSGEENSLPCFQPLLPERGVYSQRDLKSAMMKDCRKVGFGSGRELTGGSPALGLGALLVGISFVKRVGVSLCLRHLDSRTNIRPSEEFPM